MKIAILRPLESTFLCDILYSLKSASYWLHHIKNLSPYVQPYRFWESGVKLKILIFGYQNVNFSKYYNWFICNIKIQIDCRIVRFDISKIKFYMNIFQKSENVDILPKSQIRFIECVNLLTTYSSDLSTLSEVQWPLFCNHNVLLLCLSYCLKRPTSPVPPHPNSKSKIPKFVFVD